MTERTLKIKIDCGEETCASVRGKFCQYLSFLDFGSTPVCTLFRAKHGSYTDLEDTPTGWVARCSACIELEGKESK